MSSSVFLLPNLPLLKHRKGEKQAQKHLSQGCLETTFLSLIDIELLLSSFLKTKLYRLHCSAFLVGLPGDLDI